MLLVACDIIVFLFCFKQKTAYEMRISDWSSDGCSSDLYGAGAAAFALGAERVIARLLGSGSVTAPFVDHFRASQSRYDYFWEEIGRASCRDRVCQYV